MTLLLVGVAAVADDEARFGLPRTGQAVEVLRNPGFVVGYSEARRQPLWVAWRAESVKGTRKPGKRPRFEVDARTRARVGYYDYSGSGYTRGHLAPNNLITRLYGRAAQQATFLMSNISPQTPRLNELVWERLETAEAYQVAPRAVQVWVLAGPLFAAQPPTLKSGVPVPEAFFRIWLDLEQGEPRALAFIVPQEVCGTEPLSRYLASVDEVERRSGLDFFADLEDAGEARLEAVIEPQGWDLPRWERRPPHYGNKFDLRRCAHDDVKDS